MTLAVYPTSSTMPQDLPQNFYLRTDRFSMLDSQREIERAEIQQRKWSAISDEIQEWMNNPTILANEEGEFPSRATILLAWRLAKKMAGTGESAPIAVVPDNNVGISFEWRNGPISRWLEISSTGNIEEIELENGRVRYRGRCNFDD
jgi:hypothetical protein